MDLPTDAPKAIAGLIMEVQRLALPRKAVSFMQDHQEDSFNFLPLQTVLIAVEHFHGRCRATAHFLESVLFGYTEFDPPSSERNESSGTCSSATSEPAEGSEPSEDD